MSEQDVRQDESVVWYGPHACEECGGLIVKPERARGADAFDVPEHLLRVYHRGAESGNVQITYPAVWKPHVHRSMPSMPPKE